MIVNELHQNCPYSSICFCDENVVTVTKFYVFAQFFLSFYANGGAAKKNISIFNNFIIFAD